MSIESRTGPQTSRRSAFRFRCRKEPVSYRTDYEEGEALLTNISTDGCALEQATLMPEPGEQLLIRIELADADQAVEARGEAVRVEERAFAARFLIIEPESKSLVRTYFSKKRRGT